MDPKLKEELGKLLDKAENFLAAAKLPMPPSVHVVGLTGGIEQIAAKLRELIAE